MKRLLGTAAVAALALASARCGLLGAPGGYSGGAEDPPGASDGSTAAGDGASRSDGAVLPDGNAASVGTIAVLAGERDPTSPADDPAWSADAWSGILDASGRVAVWRIDKSAPIVGSFDCAGLVGTKWMAINVGFGLSGNRGTALQQTSWLPGIAGDWRAATAEGAPGGLNDTTRAFFGAHLAYVGGTRTVAVDGGTNTFFTNEVHASAVDATKNELGSSADTGAQLVRARSRPSVVLGPAAMYVIGGRVPSGLASSVEMAKVDAVAGTVSAFTDQPGLKEAGAEHKPFLPGVAIEGGYLWVAGGRTALPSTPTDIVLSSKIDPATGALADFQSVTKLPKPLRDFAFVAFRGRLYVIGGASATTRSDEVFSASIGANGTLGAWAQDAKLPGARSDFVALAY